MLRRAHDLLYRAPIHATLIKRFCVVSTTPPRYVQLMWLNAELMIPDIQLSCSRRAQFVFWCSTEYLIHPRPASKTICNHVEMRALWYLIIKVDTRIYSFACSPAPGGTPLGQYRNTSSFRLNTSSRSERYPATVMRMSRSARRLLTTWRQPWTPSCDMPHTYRRPIMTASAPSAIALKMSAPVRMPESNMTVISGRTPASISTIRSS